MVESDTPGRLQAAETALRLAMLAVLGPRSINEKKFSQWSTKLEVLGLEFDTEQKTVSMPVAKIKKTLDRVRQAASNPTISKHDLECLLGSLRHVSTCLRTARPFFQRVHAACKRAPSRGRVPVSASLRIDFDWLQRILNGGQWRSLPTIMFYGDPPPDVHIYMDASDEGLAVLDPARQRYIRVQFDSQERDDITHCAGRDGFTINVRELFCIALAAKAWGSDWVPQFPSAMTFVRAWSDNASAVAWVQSLNSDNLLAQELIRAIGLAEATFRFRISARHLPDSANIMADAASRSWKSPFREVWTNFACCWSQTQITDATRKMYKTFSRVSRPMHWPSQVGENTLRPGDNGAGGAAILVPHPGSVDISSKTPLNSSRLRYGAGESMTEHPATRHPPFCRRLATSAGIIGAIAGTPSVSTQDTSSLCKGCRGSLRRRAENNPSRRCYSGVSAQTATSPRFTTEFSGGATVVGFFFLLRRSEYLTDHGKYKPFALQRHDVTFWTSEGRPASSVKASHTVQLKLRGSKTDQRGIGATRTLEQSRSSWLWPVRAAWALVENGKAVVAADDSLLCTITKDHALSAETMSKTIKVAAQDLGEDAAKFGTHSLRSGGPTAMFVDGVDRLAIKHFGRWSSDCYEQYARRDGATIKALATGMVHGAGE